MEAVHITNKKTSESFDVFGPTIAFLSPIQENGVYCIMQGAIPPGVAVPLHSHPDDESFYILSGIAEVLTQDEDRFIWTEVKTGRLVHVRAGAKHAWRNKTTDSVEILITTTSRLARFFREIGRPIIPGKKLSKPTPEELQSFVQIAEKYNHWTGSPQENAAVGISVIA
jgi:quercetin dioxygenase-like cupin family protein